MFHALLKQLAGIEQYGIFSLCLFCSIFTGVLIWAFAQKKSHLDYMAQVALDNQTPTSQEGDGQDE
jgi:hypothetical protein